MGSTTRRTSKSLSMFSIMVMSMVEVGMGVEIGVNWGTLSSHMISPNTVVDLLILNHIRKVKIFDTDPSVLSALVHNPKIDEVMVGIPNDLLEPISASVANSDLWVSRNLSVYYQNHKSTPNIRYIAVGNEPFLSSYSSQYQSYVIPALTNLQQSLARANLASFVKLVVPCNDDAYEADVPSQGAFRPELTQIMNQLVSVLNSNGSPFVVNIYPFLSLSETRISLKITPFLEAPTMLSQMEQMLTPMPLMGTLTL